MSVPSDQTLTNTGLSATGTGKVLVIGCGAIAREILAVVEANALTHITVTCLPAILHNTPDQIVPALSEKLIAATGFDRIFIAYADCGTGGGIEALAGEFGATLLPGAHCYAFFEGVESFAARDEITAFYLTDFLARQFDAFVTKPLGLDRHPELRDIYFQHYEKLVYLAQTDDPALTERAKAAADALGLAFERRATGYGDLAPALTAL